MSGDDSNGAIVLEVSVMDLQIHVLRNVLGKVLVKKIEAEPVKITLEDISRNCKVDRYGWELVCKVLNTKEG